MKNFPRLTRLRNLCVIMLACCSIAQVNAQCSITATSTINGVTTPIVSNGRVLVNSVFSATTTPTASTYAWTACNPPYNAGDCNNSGFTPAAANTQTVSRPFQFIGFKGLRLSTTTPNNTCQLIFTIVPFIASNATPASRAIPLAGPICSPYPVLYAQIGQTTGVSYQWQLNGSNISGATGQTYTLGSTPAPGSYTVVVSFGNASVGSPLSSDPVIVGAAPVLSGCPSSILLNTALGLCSNTATYNITATGTPAPTFTYTLSGATATSGPQPGTGSGVSFNTGTTLVTVTATNACGSRSCSFNVQVVDNQRPVVMCPMSPALQATYPADEGSCEAALEFAVTATDNCGVDGGTGIDRIEYSIDGVAQRAYRPITSRTALATQPNTNLPFTLNINNIFAVGPHTITATAYDLAGNASLPCSFNFTVIDTQKPTITCPVPATSYPADIATCSKTISFEIGAKDNCAICQPNGIKITVNGGSPINLSYSRTTALLPSCVEVAQTTGVLNYSFPVGTNVVVATVTDIHGNTETCSFNVVVVSNVAASIAAPDPNSVCQNASPAPVITFTGSGGVAPYTFSYSVNGATTPSTVSTTMSNSATVAQPTTTPGTFTYTLLSVTDAIGCSKSYTMGNTATITVKPNPTIMALSTNAYTLCSGGSLTYSAIGLINGSTIFNYTLTGPSTNFTNATFTATVTDGSYTSGLFTYNNVGTYTFTLNSITVDGCTTTLTTNNTLCFVVFPPAPAAPIVNMGCGAITVTPTAVIPEFTAQYSFDDGSTWGPNTPPTADNCLGYKIRTRYVTTSACTNVPAGTAGPMGCNQSAATIRKVDITAPVIAPLPATTTINCPATPVFAVATATDACGSAFTLTSADVTTPGACAGSYSVTRTWTATDACGNSSTASQTINVQDITAPVIAPLPATTTINCPATPVFAVATATDACGSAFTLTSADVTTPGACAGSYSVTRTWTATDACGNSSTASQTINVQDITAPVIAPLPATTTINCPATPVFAVATATDACGSAFTLTSADVTTPGDCAGSYSVTRTWTATDACGNSSTASQTINVQDVTAPVIAPLPATTTINCPATPVFAVATATDACGSAFTLTSADVTTPGACAGSYSVTRTWTATDACGNSSTASQTINVQDVTAPVIAPLPATTTINCPATPVFAVATATDACGSAFTLTSADVTTPGACAGSYSVTRTWTATDACGNSSTASQTINVQDITAPVIAPLPATTTINCPATPVFAVATATDACGSAFTLTSADVTTPGACAGSYSVTRTWTATDACGNSSTASQTINVQDVTAPVIAPLPATTTINCPATPVFAVATATDACGSAFTLTSADVTTPGACAGSYSVTRTWTATDACGNSSTASQTINVQDITAPVIAPLPATTTINCPATPVFAVATATDACGSSFTLTSADVTTPGACAGSYSVTRTWTATDACGNSSTASQTINVQDVTAPVIAPLPATTTINCPATPVFAVATATDACGSAFTLTSADVTTPGACAGSYSVTRTWTATDACGNSSTASQTINVQDITAPVIAPLPATTTINCPATPVFAVATATDACGSAFTLTSADVTTPGDCAGSYSVTRTWTATDACGNSSTASQTINVQDVTAPVIAPLPATTTINCPATPVFAVATATDACGSAFTLTSADVTTPGACAGSYSVTRTWTATDACGNSSTASQTINVQDITAPVIAPLPATTTINCPATPVFAVATATDACGSSFTLTSADVTTPGACAGSYSVTRTWTATDACGNSSTASQTINVQDVTAPVIAPLPATTTINCPATPVFAVATATDACGSSFTLTSADVTTPGACAGSYSVTRTWTATDACGNSSTASQTINVQDVTAPVIAPLPATTTINCPATPVFAVATATDACGSAFTLTSADVTTPGACAGSYSVTRTWTATDACGNSSTASQTINVQDITAPVIAPLPATTTINCPATPVFAVATATDACGSAFTLTSADVTTPGACAGSYSVTRTWTATDACGNSSTASQTINVQDVTAPVIAPLPATTTINCPATPVFAVATATDACGSAFTLTSADVTTPGACAGSYSVTRTWTATDACGNSSTASQTINVQDITAPVIAPLPATTTINCPATPVFAVATATDACGSSFTLTSADVTTPGACAGSYSVTRTWTATDACGNSSTASQTINVQDVTAPVIAPLPATTTINCPATPVFAVATATDACGSAFTLTSADVTTPGACAGSYSVTRTWTATDACGNSSTASQTINVQDITAPVIAPLPATTTINCPATPVFAVATATDACGSAFTLTSADVTTPGDCAGSYSVTRTWTATDACGNSSTASQTINVQDVTAPVIAPLPATTTINCPATPVFAVATATDACGSAFTLTSADVTTPGACAGSYSVTRTWTATDACGNSSTASQTINVQDITAPVIAPLPATTTINCPATPVFAVATATDACGSSFTLTSADVTTPGACAGSYSVTRTWTATDACGNSSTASQTINVQDVTAPVIAPLPATTTINCPATPVFAVATATDACGSSFTLTSADVTTPGDCAGSYSVTRTWTATDACGNSSTASQTINVQDITAPVIAPLPATTTINCPATPVFAVATATDACGSSFTLTSADVTTPGACAGSYSVTRTWTATDACGNSSTASQTINVQDITAPVFSVGSNQQQTFCKTTNNIYTIPAVTATDNCSGTVTYSYSMTGATTRSGTGANASGLFNPGNSLITYTATDICGNSITTTRIVLINALPTVTINSTNGDLLCNSITLSAVPGAGSPNGSSSFNAYVWSGPSYSATTQSINLSLANGFGNYNVTVTDGNVCTSLPATYVYNAATQQNSINVYTMYALNNINVNGTGNTINGSVGVQKTSGSFATFTYVANTKVNAPSFAKALIINPAGTDANVPNKVMAAATVTALPTQLYNNGAAISGSVNVPANTTQNVTANNVNINALAGSTVTLNGNNYGTIVVYAGATIIFNGNATINVGAINMFDGSISAKTKLIFNQPTTLLVKNYLQTGTNADVNAANTNSVVMHLGASVSTPPSAITVYTNNTVFNASLISYNGQLNTTSGSITSPVNSMLSGKFILNNIAANGRNVIWNNSSACSTMPPATTPPQFVSNAAAELPVFAVKVSPAEAKKLEMKVAPNPTNGLTTIMVNGNGYSNFTVSITDLKGSSVLKKDIKNHVSKSLIPIDLTNVQKGVYLITVITKDGRMTEKLLVY